MTPALEWRSAASAVHWFTKPKPGTGLAAHPFAGGVLNLCFNCVDRHVALGRADQRALLAPTAANRNQLVELTYAQLLERVAAFAGVLRALGAAAGDRVLIVLPSSVEAVIALLGCTRLGCAATVLPPAAVQAAQTLPSDESPAVVVTTSSCRTPVAAALTVGTRPRPRMLVVHDPATGVAPGPDEVLAPATESGAAPPADTAAASDTQPAAEPDLDLAQVLRSSAVAPAECVALAASTPVDPARSAGSSLAAYTVALRWAAEQVLGARAGERHQPPAGLDPVEDPAACILAPLLVGATLDWSRLDDPGPGATAAPAISWRPPDGWPIEGGLLGVRDGAAEPRVSRPS